MNVERLEQSGFAVESSLDSLLLTLKRPVLSNRRWLLLALSSGVLAALIALPLSVLSGSAEGALGLLWLVGLLALLGVLAALITQGGSSDGEGTALLFRGDVLIVEEEVIPLADVQRITIRRGDWISLQLTTHEDRHLLLSHPDAAPVEALAAFVRERSAAVRRSAHAQGSDPRQVAEVPEALRRLREA